MKVLLQGTRQSGITYEYFKHRLEEETEQYKQEIERLTKQNKALNEMYELTKKEYIRLNNIINEFEEWLISEIKFRKIVNKDFELRKALTILQELKGEDKE